MIEVPVPEGVGSDVRALVGVLHEVEDLYHPQRGEGLGPYAHRALLALLGEDVLVVALPHAHEQPVVVRVEELVAGALRAVGVAGCATDRRQEHGLVVPVEVHFVGAPLRAGGRVTLQ